MSGPMRLSLRVDAASISDALGYRGQYAVAQAVGEAGDYRLVGGHMVRLLLDVFPAARAVARSTVDADTAVEDVEIIGQISAHLQDDQFEKKSANLFVKRLDEDQQVEVNLLLARHDPMPGLKTQNVRGVGFVDTLPELTFAMMLDPIIVSIEAHLSDSEVITYETRIPTLEAALVLKAFSWRDRTSEKDLADLNTLLEIRDEHLDLPWLLGSAPIAGYRKDAARILHLLRQNIVRAGFPHSIPVSLERRRFAALIGRHVAAA